MALLRRNDPWKYVLLAKHADAPWASSVGASDVVYTDATHYSVQEQIAVPRVIRRVQASAFYAPQFNVPLALPVPFVVTVHDLILHRFPNGASLPRRMAYRVLLRHAVRSASGIVAVSQATKDAMLEHYGKQVADKTVVAHPGVASTFLPSTQAAVADVRKRYGIDGTYLLYVGNAKQHKNVQLLIDAFSQAALPRCSLVLVTAGPEAAGLRLKSGVRVLASVPQQDLPALYTGALACVSATLAEGFGLPMLEAMACDCPVLATDIPAVREACSGHARLVAPTVDAMAQGMRDMLPAHSRAMLDAARNHALGHAWTNTARIPHSTSLPIRNLQSAIRNWKTRTIACWLAARDSASKPK